MALVTDQFQVVMNLICTSPKHFLSVECEITDRHWYACRNKLFMGIDQFFYCFLDIFDKQS